MHRSVFLSIPLLCLVTLSMNCSFVPSADAQTCGGEGVAVQVLGSGGPELQDKRASPYRKFAVPSKVALSFSAGASALCFAKTFAA
jgi:hypothetical protein